MATKKKMLEAAAGSAGGASLDITDVFSTYLYDGVSSALTINNGIDLTKGGLVWTKRRNISRGHVLFDSERGASSRLRIDTGAAANQSYSITYNSNGYSWSGADNDTTIAGSEYVSWTFRKAPKFFTCLTYTGDGDFTGRTISHSLGSVPGMILIKKTSSTADWIVYHRSEGATKSLQLNNTDPSNTYNMFNDTAPTATEFSVSSYSKVNNNGDTYVAYLFAHNDGDGTFGPDADQDIIKCGSLTDGGAAINLGFEPQFVLIKRTDTDSVNPSSGSRASKGNWMIADVMRSMTVSDPVDGLAANLSDAEILDDFYIKPTPTGFSYDSLSYDGTGDFIYMAIRRGPLAPPEAGTEVFAIDTMGGTATDVAFYSGGVVDMGIQKNYGAIENWYIGSRLTGLNEMNTNATTAESNLGTYTGWDYMTGYNNYALNANYYSWMWKRAPGYFDCVAYSGNSTAGRAVSHNLTVAPEMMWVKKRSTTGNWGVYHSDTGATKYLGINTTNEARTLTSPWNDTAPTSSVFTLGTSALGNGSGVDYIAYLFASLAGVSKVGSYVGLGAGNPLTIDCGFTSGARFVLIKKTDAATGSAPDGSWFIFDSVRGITTSANPYLQLNTTSAEASNFSIEPHSSGFTVIQDGPTELNQTGKNYIFYAIA